MSVDDLLIVQQNILNGRFMMTIRHKECENAIGLVKGGLSRQPRMWCEKCDIMLSSDEVDITFVEIEEKPSSLLH